MKALVEPEEGPSRGLLPDCPNSPIIRLQHYKDPRHCCWWRGSCPCVRRVLVVTGSWWLNNCIIARPGDTAESCNNDQILQYKYHVNTNKYTLAPPALPPATCGSLQPDTDNRVSFVHMQQPLKYLTHLSTFWPIRMTVTRYLRQKTCCVPFFEYLMKSVSLTSTNKKPWLHPIMKDFYILGGKDLPFSSWIWARWIFCGTWHMSAVTRRVRTHYRVCRHLSLRRVWPRAATLPPRTILGLIRGDHGRFCRQNNVKWRRLHGWLPIKT